MVESVVDYVAWKRGYMPPSEHRLIDELSYRGAKVVASSESGDFSFWLVVKGTSLTRKQRAAFMKFLELTIDELPEKEPTSHPLAAEYELSEQEGK